MKRLLIWCCALWMVGSMACYLDRSVQCTENKDCLGGATCESKKCTCPGGQAFCNEGTPAIVCVDKKTSASHCGACNNSCAAGEQCVDGSCKGCGANTTICGGGCVNTKINPKHCGACGNECKGGRACKDGKCACPTGFDVCNDICVDTQKSTDFCGGCAPTNKCAAGQACLKGKCGTCPKTCGDVCPDLKTDVKHCGACDAKCKTNESCCDGKCIDFKTDNNNCGKCGDKCPSGSTCKAGKCDCGTGKTACGSSCVDIKADAKHCGQCNKACGTGESCLDGVCCKAGEKNCGGTCIDVQTDANNCGTCGTGCNGKLCKSGKCEACTKDADCGTDSGLTCDTGTGLCICGTKCGWVSTVGTPKADVVLYGVAVDTNQNVYVTGIVKGDYTFVQGKNSTTLSAKGGDDIFVAKFDGKGALAWVKRYGGSSTDTGRAIAVDTKGTVYVTGSFTEKMTVGSTTLTGKKTDIFVLGLDTAGKIKFATSGGGAENDTSLAIAVDNKGSAYITGRYAKQAQFGGNTGPQVPTASSKGIKELFVAKIGTDHKFKWALTPAKNSSGNHGKAEGRGIAVGSNDSLFVTGPCEDEIKTDNSSICKTGDDMFVLETTTSGGTFKDGASTQGPAPSNAIAVDGSNVPFVVGSFQSAKFGTAGVNAKGQLDLFLAIMKLSTMDFTTTITAPTTAGAGLGDGLGVAWFNDERIITGFYKDGITFDTNAFKATGDTDVFVTVLDKANKWKWSLTMGGSKEDKGYAIAIDKLGGIYVVGSFQDKVANVAVGKKSLATITAKGNKDGFVWKVAP